MNENIAFQTAVSFSQNRVLMDWRGDEDHGDVDALKVDPDIRLSDYRMSVSAVNFVSSVPNGISCCHSSLASQEYFCLFRPGSKKKKAKIKRKTSILKIFESLYVLGRNSTGVTLKFVFTRNVMSQLLSNILPSFLLVAVSFGVYLIPTEKARSRIGLSSSALLGLITLYSNSRDSAPASSSTTVG